MVARADLQVTLTAIDRASPTVKQLESSIIRFVGAVSATIAALGAITFPIAQATRFDRALRDVQKTTGFADDEIKQLGRDILALSRNLDQSAQSLAGIAAAAGQLGLGRQGAEAIIAFTESVARASTTLDLSADAAARSSAKLLNIFQLNTTQVENLFSTVNELSNTTTANAGELIDTMTRIGNTANLNAQEVAALAATAIDLGVSAEVAGTSLVKVFSRIQSNADKFADAIGISLDEFTALPALDRFREFLSFLSTQTDEVQANLITKLAGGGRIFALVNKLTTDAGNGFAVLNRNLTTANTSFDSGLSAITEYQNISKALTVQLGILRNNFNALTISIGQQFIPRLLEVTRELIEFLRTPRAAAFFRGIGESASDFLEIIIKLVKFVGDLDINFRNLLATLKLIIALQTARLFAGIAARLLQTAFAITGIGRAATVAGGPLSTIFGLFARSRAAGASTATAFRLVGASITTGIGAAITRVGAVLLRFIPLVGLVATAGTIAFSLFGDEIKGVFNDVLEFFGFVSDEQGEILDDLKEELDKDIAGFEEASATISAARTKLASGALDLPERNFAAIISEDIEGLNAALLIAQERIKTLGELSSAAATASEIFARAADRFAAAATAQGREVNAAQEALNELLDEQQARERSLEFEQSLPEILQSETRIAEVQETILDLEEQIIAARKRVNVELQATVDLREVGRRRAEQSAEQLKAATEAAEEQAEIFAKIAQGLTGPIVEGFEFEIDARLAELELARVEQQLGELRQQLSTAVLVGGETGPEAVALERQIRALEGTVQLFEIQAKSARGELNEFTDGLSAAEEFVFNRHLPNLAKTVEGLEATRASLGGINREGLQATTTLDEGFQKSLVSLIQQRAELQKLAEANAAEKKGLEDLAKAAKASFDNTATEVRAFTRSVLASVEELRISLAQRPLEIKFERTQTAIREELDTIEEARADLEARLTEIEEQEQGSRLQGVFTFEKNKTKAELDALDERSRILAQRERDNERARIEQQFEDIQARTADFLRRAQELAEAGSLDEALGLKELAKQQIPDLFDALNQLSGLTTAEGDPLVNLDQIETLVGQVQKLSGEVAEEIPEINQALLDTTEANLTEFTAAAAITTERLSNVNASLEEMGRSVANFNQILPQLTKIVLEGSRVTGSTAAGATLSTEGGFGTALGLEVDALLANKDATEQQTVGQTQVTTALVNNAAAVTQLNEELRQSRIQQEAGSFQHGGMVRGRGTGTSDSIAAMLSKGEFVVNAATTRAFGSPFFHGLQSIARRGLTVPRFGVGGLAGGLPGFEPVIQAAGAGGSPVNIHLPSGDVVRLREGQTDSQTVVRMFKREARKRGSRGA